MSYIFLALTIVLTVYGQIVLKWQVSLNPGSTIEGLNPRAIVMLLLNPWVISAFAAAFSASMCWMAAINRMPLSKAYPFMALSFPIVAVLAVWLFNESFDLQRVFGTSLIVAGVVVLAQSGS
ncbi:EamA family transporter [Luteimonas fraxinea]|uniref:EamA family transporter n=1 Tax=Luteimonas fraxinea TaxID=2901869 RepID=A0ABS8UJB7_9GAMM|nr:EamA family transporter [Luteimonas fraxinea]MCD9098590.1 EamA family transporter [Luteimonas fraxinea]MCD9127323.1 EamA family transporter [Luteimonas fraxinea]UHH09007.1 EamA family transporter [Luteimonas fraxinea]